MKKCLIYSRVSTEEQAREGQSIDAQFKQCKRYAKDNQIIIAKDGQYKDEGKTGSNMNRPGLQSLLDRVVEDKSVTHILVLDTDRLCRNTLDHLTLKAFFKKNDVQLISISQLMIDDSPEGRFMDTVLASVNAFYSQITARKTSKVMEEKIKAGWWAGKAPTGYINIDNPHFTSNLDKRIVAPHPVYGPLVTQMFELYSSGTYSLETLSKKLTALGLKTIQGTHVQTSITARILNNPFYYGVIMWKGEEYPAKHQALITKELFQSCQAIMKSHNQNGSRKRVHNFLLRGFVFDADTQERYWGEKHKKPDGRVYAYYFNKNNKKGSYVSTEELEKEVEKWFGKVEMTEEYANDLRAEAKKVLTNLRSTNDEEKKAYVNQKTAITTKMKTAEDNLLDGTLTKDRFQAIIQRLENELAEVEEQINQVSKDYDKGFARIERLIDMAKNIKETYKEADYALKRDYLELFFEKFLVRSGKIVEAIPSKELKPLIKNGKITVRVKDTWLPLQVSMRMREWLKHLLFEPAVVLQLSF